MCRYSSSNTGQENTKKRLLLYIQMYVGACIYRKCDVLRYIHTTYHTYNMNIIALSLYLYTAVFQSPSSVHVSSLVSCITLLLYLSSLLFKSTPLLHMCVVCFYRLPLLPLLDGTCPPEKVLHTSNKGEIWPVRVSVIRYSSPRVYSVLSSSSCILCTQQFLVYTLYSAVLVVAYYTVAVNLQFHPCV